LPEISLIEKNKRVFGNKILAEASFDKAALGSRLYVNRGPNIYGFNVDQKSHIEFFKKRSDFIWALEKKR
jgi:hypothetical protein